LENKSIPDKILINIQKIKFYATPYDFSRLIIFVIFLTTMVFGTLRKYLTKKPYFM